MAKTICRTQHTQKCRKNYEDGKALIKLMNSAVYGKTTEKLNRI